MKIILLDRDGTVIVNPPDERVDKVEKIELFPDTLEALKYLADNDFVVVLITNQAGIAEGRIDEQDFHRINDKMLEMFAPTGIKVLGTYMCPHVSSDNCACRKPKPTMLLWAARDFDINLADVYMVGDRLSDVEAGVSAGTKTILVRRTAKIPVEAPEANYAAENLLDAVKYVVSH